VADGERGRTAHNNAMIRQGRMRSMNHHRQHALFSITAGSEMLKRRLRGCQPERGQSGSRKTGAEEVGNHIEPCRLGNRANPLAK